MSKLKDGYRINAMRTFSQHGAAASFLKSYGNIFFTPAPLASQRSQFDKHCAKLMISN